MYDRLFQTFKSPYQIVTLESRRYRHITRCLFVLLVVLPVLFLLVRTPETYFWSRVVVLAVFPLSLWLYLKSEEVSDLKLDAIKIFTAASVYFLYLTFLIWVMIRMFNPALKLGFVLLSLGYIFLLAVISVIVVFTFFHNRYARRIISRS